MTQDRKSLVAWLQAAPMMLVFVLFFLLPLVFVTIVSAWDYNEYEMIPAFSLRGYSDTFEGCISGLPDLCTILKTYLKTLKLCLMTWSLTLLIGFTVAYFLAFHVRSKTWQIVLSLLCTIPFWTSNVIRMIAWIPLLGRNGLVNKSLQGAGLIQQPLEWLLFSEFSVVLALVHLFTFFMVVPIFNSMIRIDKRLVEAAYDAGASGWQTLVNIIIPLAKPGIVIGSIFVITIVMGDFVTIGVMGGQQIASAGKIIESRLNALQFPAAAANAVILLGITILIISALTRVVDIRKSFRGATFLFYVAIASLIMPSIITSLGIALEFRLLDDFIIKSGAEGWTTAMGLLTSGLGAHLTWTLPFGLLIMFAIFNRFDGRLEEAARDLGATPWQTFRHVVLPIILPSVVGIGLFGFTLSWDELARSSQAIGSVNTLPLDLQGLTTTVTKPDIYALGTITSAVSFVVIFVALGVIRLLQTRQMRYGSDAGKGMV